jgi:hypothetical protein
MRGRIGGGKISPIEWPRIQSRCVAIAWRLLGEQRPRLRLHGATCQKENSQRGAAGRSLASRFSGSAFVRLLDRRGARRRVAETIIPFLFRFEHVLNENTSETLWLLQAATKNLLRRCPGSLNALTGGTEARPLTAVSNYALQLRASD